MCAQASVHLHRVTTADGLRLVADGFQAEDIAIVDCLTATTALDRATAALAATRTDGQPMPVHIAHPNEDFVEALRVTYDRPLVWLPPEWAGLTLLVTLRLLGVSSARSMVPVGNGGGVTPARNASSRPQLSDTVRGQQAPLPSAALTATVAASPTPVMAITAITATQIGTAIPATPVATVLTGTTASASITSTQPSPAVTTTTPAAMTTTTPASITITATAVPPSVTATAMATVVGTPIPTDTATITTATTTTAPITTVVAALNAAPAVTETGLTQGYGRLPLSFVPNQGQVDPAVQFVSRAPGLALYLTAGDATLVLVKPRPRGHRHQSPGGSALLAAAGLSATVPISAAAVRLHYMGANTAAQAIGQNQLPGIANYLIGRDPAGWRTGLPTYAQVSYQDVYPGVDLVYYGNQAQLEYDWRVAPGADPRAIAFQVQGARGLSVDGDGNLVVATDVGALVQRPPTVYQQDADGSRHAIAARYRAQDIPGWGRDLLDPHWVAPSGQPESEGT